MSTEYTRACSFNSYRHDGPPRRWNGVYFNCWEILHIGIVVLADISQLIFNELCNSC